jgi:MFS transporter, DHA2 family, multidrug resistance protein
VTDGQSRLRWVLTACCVVAFAKLVDPQAWMMGLNIPDSAFGSAWAGYRAFAAVNTLFLVGFLLLGGVLGDRLGRRRVLLIGAGVATLANVLALFATGPVWYIVTRALEGFSSALALPMTLAVIRLNFHEAARPRALLVYTFVTLAAALVSLIALVLAESFGWRATLVLPILAGALGTFLAWRYVPESRAEGVVGRRRAVTATAWSLVLLALTIGVLALQQYGTWRNPVTVVAVPLGVLGAVAVNWSSRLKPAAPPPRLTWRQRHTLTVMLLAAVALSLGLSGYLLQCYSFFTVVQGYGVILGGVALAPVLLVCVPLARPAARLSISTAPRRLIAGGLASMGLAMAMTALVRPDMPYWPLVLPMALFGFGFLLAQTAWNNAFLSALPANHIGVSASVSKAAAQAGTLLGTALLGSLVVEYGQADFVRQLSSLGLSSAQIDSATAAVNVSLRASLPFGNPADGVAVPLSVLDATLLDLYYQSYTVGLAVALLWAATVCIGIAVLAWLVLRPMSASPEAANLQSDPIPLTGV